MIGIKLLSDLPGEWGFIELRVVERRAKRAESGPRQKLSHGAGDRRGIDSTGKKRAHRNIATQANPHRLSHALTNSFDCLLHGRDGDALIAIRWKLWNPEPGAHKISAASQSDGLARSKFPNPLHMRAGRRDVAQSEKLSDRSDVQPRIDAGQRQQGLHFRSKRESAACNAGPVKRLLAKAIPRQQQFSAACVEKSKGKHAFQIVEQILSLVFEGSTRTSQSLSVQNGVQQLLVFPAVRRSCRFRRCTPPTPNDPRWPAVGRRLRGRLSLDGCGRAGSDHP